MTVALERWPMAAPFRITGYTFTAVEVVVVTLSDGRCTGRGEGAGIYYLDDTPARAAAQLEAVRPEIEAGLTREDAARLLPAGGARNALDCALWDLEAQRSGQPVWRLAGLEPPRRLVTAYTVSADLPELMAAKARRFADARAIKLKLTGEPEDAERVTAVRAARPDVWLGVDANQGFDRESLAALTPALEAARVALIEQPFPMGRDDLLDGFSSPIPIAADESAQTLADVERLAGKVQVVNVKLDKSGGLTEALAMARAARRLGMAPMVGNMFGTVLAMAPGFLVGQLCEVVDLDGPMGLVSDRSPGVIYEEGQVWCPPEAWGDPAPQAVEAGR
jgi:L-alanine-DL-glutamate epimerase-like enolase superfamily enzyme